VSEFEAAEADVVEQAQTVEDVAEPDRRERPLEADDADAAEQDVIVEGDEDYR